MINIIKAELYKFKLSRDLWICLLFVGVMAYVDFKFSTGNFADQLLTSVTTIPFLLIFIISNWALEPHKDKTLKNYFTVGNKKSEVYFGRLISGLVIAFCVFVMVAIVNVVISVVLKYAVDFALADVIFSLFIQLVIICIYGAIYYGLASVLRNSLITFAVSFLIAYFDNFIFSGIGKYLHFSTLSDYSLSAAESAVEKLHYGADLWIALGVGVCVAVIVNAAGYFMLKKKTI